MTDKNRVKSKFASLKYIIPALVLLGLASFIGAYLIHQETTIPDPINPYRKGIVIGSSERALEILKDMTTEEKVGQLYITTYRNDEKDKDNISEYKLGGILYSGGFFESKTPDLASKVFKEMAEASYPQIFQCVAEEGGEFVAVSKWEAFRLTPFKLPRALYDEAGLEGVISQEEEKLLMLRRMGINLNFGPITNIVTDPSESLYEQTLGQGVEETQEYIRRLTLLYDEIGMSAVLRYYTADQTEAFMTGCYMGAPAVMMTNRVLIQAGSIDKNRPMSLSKKWHDYLRQDLGFEGVIIISDVASSFFDEYIEDNVISVTALKAGNNMIWASNFEEEIAGVLAALEDGSLDMGIVDDSVTRILTWKIRYGLLE